MFSSNKLFYRYWIIDCLTNYKQGSFLFNLSSKKVIFIVYNYLCNYLFIILESSGTDQIVHQNEFDHVVNLGGTLTPAVLGHSDRLTCHIITNNGEDLVIDADSDYPKLQLTTSERHTCRIAIGPITETMLGNWTIYGRFRDFTGLHEERLPMHLFLYGMF